MSRRSCGVLPIVAYVVGTAERINWMRQPARETFEAEATRLRARRSKISESEALSRGLGRAGAVGPLIPRLQEPRPGSPRHVVLDVGVRQHSGR